MSPIRRRNSSSRAINFCNAIGLTTSKRRRKRYDMFFESLSIYGVTLDVMEDKDWEALTYDLTIGHCDPASLTITVPNKIYVNACLGEEHALAVIFHELGHLLLGHKPVLHFSAKEPTPC